MKIIQNTKFKLICYQKIWRKSGGGWKKRKYYVDSARCWKIVELFLSSICIFMTFLMNLIFPFKSYSIIQVMYRSSAFPTVPSFLAPSTIASRFNFKLFTRKMWLVYDIYYDFTPPQRTVISVYTSCDDGDEVKAIWKSETHSLPLPCCLPS